MYNERKVLFMKTLIRFMNVLATVGGISMLFAILMAVLAVMQYVGVIPYITEFEFHPYLISIYSAIFGACLCLPVCGYGFAIEVMEKRKEH